MYTKVRFLSSKYVSEHFSFAEIIHPPHRCAISRCWLDSMIIAQVCLSLSTIQGHSKMCSFTVLGGSKNQSVSGVTTICLTQCNTSPLHRVDQVVYCGLGNVGPLLFNGCAKLLNIGKNWNTLSYTPIQSIQNMLNGWHVRWVFWPCKNWDVFSFQELCTDPCNMGPCIIMLQHEVMVVDEWHNNGPQDLVTLSLCIQNAINKMHLCSLSITYTCPYLNPTATMGHSIHTLTSANRSPIRCHTASVICPVQWKPGFIHEKNTSPKCQTPSNVSICPLKSLTTTNCSQVKYPDEDGEHADEVPWNGFWQFLTDCCSSCPGGWSQTILEVKMLDVEVLGWCGYMGSAVVKPVGCTAKFSEMPLETAYGREMNIQFTGNSSGGHSCS